MDCRLGLEEGPVWGDLCVGHLLHTRARLFLRARGRKMSLPLAADILPDCWMSLTRAGFPSSLLFMLFKFNATAELPSNGGGRASRVKGFERRIVT